MKKQKRQGSSKRSKKLARANQGSVHFVYFSFILFGIGLLALASAVFFAMRPSALTESPLGSLTHTEGVPDTQELLVRVNDARTTHQKHILKTDATLQAIAEARLSDMIKNQQYDHRDSSGKYFYDLLREQSYATEYSCENLAIETTTTPQRFVDSWLRSSTGHRDCLLHDKISHVGVASGPFTIDNHAKKHYLVVVIFAKPL